MTLTKPVSIIAAAAAVVSLSAFVAPAAMADDAAVVTSSRSFKGQESRTTALLKESTSTSVKDTTKYGGIESLNVPKTKSKAEKDAEAAAKAAAEAAQQAAQEAAQQAAQQQATSSYASRSQSRSAATGTGTGTTSSSNSAAASSSSAAAVTDTAAATTPASGTATAVVETALQYQGAPYVYGGSTPSGWDCSGFLMYVFAKFGVSLPHSSGAQAAVGTPVASLADAKPGDILANSTHSAIYVGDGMIMNALNPSRGTQLTPVSWGFPGGNYAIRRVL
ncbi:C40 family peptidase [Bifidobacterium simiarum]|uniref:C40 family peptidase n=1 Tax=Bifidobacterium simiarum TaxID=2045441 RepID=UPI001BDBE733|nr:C40 family peptidase [Bifidobacterium simiarum]MBT1167211.1 C40 family peptidase [Bifidobacterium simiarum]